jgi:hypothetical protein
MQEAFQFNFFQPSAPVSSAVTSQQSPGSGSAAAAEVQAHHAVQVNAVT